VTEVPDWGIANTSTQEIYESTKRKRNEKKSGRKEVRYGGRDER